MLHEVGEAELLFVFQDRTRVDGKAEFGAVLRLGVAPDVVHDPVLQRVDPDVRVDGQRRLRSGANRVGSLSGVLGSRIHMRRKKQNQAEGEKAFHTASM